MKKGFTLVELSIVLVVIGLLTAGVLVGQSLIQSAKISSAVRKLQQYDVAIEQFKVKFKSIPGDSPSFIPSGTNDKQITDDSGCYTTGSNAGYSAWEAFQIWPHLSQAKMISENFPAWNPTSGAGIGCSPSGIHPASFVDIGGIITPVIFESQYWISVAGSVSKKISTFYRENQWDSPHFGFSAEPYQAISLDTKLDNGNTGTGNFFAGYRTPSDNSTVTLGLPSCGAYINAGGSPATLCEVRWYFKSCDKANCPPKS